MEEPPKITPIANPKAARFDWPFAMVFLTSWMLSLSGLFAVRAVNAFGIERSYLINYLIVMATGAGLAFPSGCGMFLTFSSTPFWWRVAVVAGAIFISIVTPELMTERPYTDTPLFEHELSTLLIISLQLFFVVSALSVGRLFWKWRFRQGDEIEPPPRLALWHLFAMTTVVAAIIGGVELLESRSESGYGSVWFPMFLIGVLPAFTSLLHVIIGMWTILRFRSLLRAVVLSVLPIVVLVAGLALFVLLATSPGFFWNPAGIAQGLLWFFAGYTVASLLPHFILRFFGKRLVAGI